MIVDFSATNFRSIKDEQVLSMHAENPGGHLAENISFPSNDKLGVLSVIGIYGANASGKSNLLRAFSALRYMVSETGNLKEDDCIPCYEPFLLDSKSKTSPVRFEVEFVMPDGYRYQYRIAFTSNKITEEHLSFYPGPQPALIFDRKEEDTWRSIRFGGLYKGGKKRLSFFDNNSYLSKAGNSADAPEMIRTVYKYLLSHLLSLGVNQSIMKINWHEEKDLVEKVQRLLCFVDTGISGMEIVDDEDLDTPDIKVPDHIPDEVRRAIIKGHQKKILFSHESKGDRLEYFEEEEESAGTRKLFRLAPIIIETLKYGGVLILDELDNSMHPFMAELIIKLFNDSRVNKNNAQLIFSTHNIALMSPERFRRDQIWFTEKKYGETSLYSLDDFDKKKVKSNSPFYQWYTEGRFDAVPKIDYQSIVDLLGAIE